MSRNSGTLSLSDRMVTAAERPAKPGSAPSAEGAPVVSVFMPTWNGEGFLPETLDSILGQTFWDFELVVVDDCSSDGTWELLQAYAARDSRLVIERLEQNEGHASASNRALARCRGRWLARHDQDDVSLPTRIEKQVSALEADSRIALSASGYYRWDGAGERSPRCLGLSHTEVRWRLLFENCLCHSSAMFPGAILEPGEGYRDLPGPQDFDLWIRLSRRGSVHVLPEPLVLYRVHGQGMTGLFEQRQAEAVTQLSREQLRRMLPNEVLSLAEVRQLYRHKSPHSIENPQQKAAMRILTLFQELSREPDIDSREIHRLRRSWLRGIVAAAWRQAEPRDAVRFSLQLLKEAPLPVVRFGVTELPGLVLGRWTRRSSGKAAA